MNPTGTAALPDHVRWRRDLPRLRASGADRTLNSTYVLPLFETAFPDGTVTELPRVGHYSIEDAPDTVGELLSRFLDATTTQAE
ncbi:alpha/beta fold hydrolase [Planotetraspora kaengkrachanensis]|uniref:Haloalkane dehalogenase n=1 Tax=Planotetraspora kaengkrachanensis TaxID=575193 RepID=A0A8J3LRA9_9ACTN|nr:hypothetical protein [Planotetraspora kaengkrachanensis]GIG77768.1 hypothetical protein Pka01_08950 [Planotetraspora kaengkrachanensis]